MLDYQRRMSPTIKRVIGHHASGTGPRLAFEGSALLPENMAHLQGSKVLAVCLTASSDFLTERIHDSSSYADLDREARMLVDRFVARNALINNHYVETAKRHNVRLIDVEIVTETKDVVELCLA